MKRTAINLSYDQAKVLDEALSVYRSIKMGRLEEISNMIIPRTNSVEASCRLSNMFKEVGKNSRKVDESDSPEEVKLVNDIQNLVRKYRNG